MSGRRVTETSVIIILGWNDEDDRLLAEKVRNMAKANDKVSFKARLNKFDWAQIAFKNYSPKDCENRFNTHMKHVRRHRNLNEIAVDIETYIKQKSKVKKPCNSYQLFMMDQVRKIKNSEDFVSKQWHGLDAGYISYANCFQLFQTVKMKTMGKQYRELPVEEKAIYEHKAKQLMKEYLAKKAELT